MKKKVVVASALLLALVLLVQVSGASSSSNNKILEFRTMIGVSGPFVGANPINGVTGAGHAWRIASARGQLQTDGSLEVEVKGLVLAGGANDGVNPQDHFRAVVACQTIGDDGQATTASAVTPEFPATPQGDSEIEANVSIPSPCFDPAVFVTSKGTGTPAWFAVAGR
jgi:hypothetical protein